MCDETEPRPVGEFSTYEPETPPPRDPDTAARAKTSADILGGALREAGIVVTPSERDALAVEDQPS